MVHVTREDEYHKLVGTRAWIGVDMDSTLFHYNSWQGWNVFGEPIAPMVERVRRWCEMGVQVRIVTARVGLPASWVFGPDGELVYSRKRDGTCRVTAMSFSDHEMAEAIRDHLQRHGLPRLPVQCFKDADMIHLWDDRAIQVVPNTGQTLRESCADAIVACDECDCASISRRRILEG